MLAAEAPSDVRSSVLIRDAAKPVWAATSRKPEFFLLA